MTPLAGAVVLLAAAVKTAVAVAAALVLVDTAVAEALRALTDDS